LVRINSRIIAGFVPVLASALLALHAAEPLAHPVRVCEVLQNLASFNGKTIAIVGRYSFRSNGRFLSEDTCGSSLKTGDFTWPCSLRVTFDPKTAPKAPDPFEVDGGAVGKLLALVKEHTSLAKFRFGTPDYDRWAVAYGRVATTREFDNSGPGPGAQSGKFEPAPASLVCAGDALVIFLVNH
jgi:hypothetical protein